MGILTLNEAILLLAIWRLGEDAYGVTIREKVVETTGKTVVYGTLYNSLDKLVKKGFVAIEKGEPTAERGGRHKIYYHLTGFGLESLKKTRELHFGMWDGIGNLDTEAQHNE